ncbi:hypothetical protein D6D13_00854 [Aureobasidium pullulans]|uniref:Uncharacterized protein n=1 Tax=Aureobasidium pullulans TaxID=5580 RepID=A0A4S9S8A9_AURPU|nr:hypothetical protein D6D29_01354 [Aureobasidium pullulans]THX17148.1 hypothetical protein D6D13_00854 [Aureobasidium pullulans]THZ06486.1 hypothetical protein D6C93_01460 [Aureobasidium pullulans]TIA20000.1 hypothetical protein D6C81_04413 [Aureobasidium pullulans]TIA55853.1 hypothetical protein D6C79_00248 [Aureobasidium pullulans]
MFKRQPLAAVSSVRPRCPVSLRSQSVRYRSDLNWADRQRGQEKGSNTMPTNPAPEHTPTPHNQPATGRSRQQRAAQVSEEVRMLNRGSTAATVSGGNNSRYPSTQSKDVDPEAVGGTGQMGANEPVGRESAFSQSPGRPVRAGRAPREMRSEHSPSGAVSDPNDGGEVVLEDAEGNEELVEDEDEDVDANDELGRDPMGDSTANELTILEQFDKQDVTAVPFEPETVTRDEYLKLGQGGATIAAGNFAGVLEDRIKIVAEATQDEFRYAPDIAKRMIKGELVSFKDEQEKADVLATIKKGGFEFSAIPSTSQNVIFDKFVRGAYPDLEAAPHKNRVLNEIARTISRNSTYLNKDSTKLLRKIGSLLPSEAAARKPSAAPRK